MTESQRGELIADSMAMVKAIAVRIHETLPDCVDLDDLINNGVIGLMQAVEKFEPAMKVPFSSYAKHRIRGAILDSLRDLDWASRDMRKRQKQVDAATRELAATLLRNPTDVELAQKLGVSEERWRSMRIDLKNVGLFSASSRSDANSDLPTPEFASNPKTYPDAICIHEQLRIVLQAALEILPPRYRKVITLYYNADMNMKEIAAVLGVNESRVSQMHKAAMEKLHHHLSNNKLTYAALA